MENLQREKQSKIEILQKIKRAQYLISLSKYQDTIIADLESQIAIEGVNLVKNNLISIKKIKYLGNYRIL